MSLATGIPFDGLADLSDDVLDLYEAELTRMTNPKKRGNKWPPP